MLEGVFFALLFTYCYLAHTLRRVSVLFGMLPVLGTDDNRLCQQLNSPQRFKVDSQIDDNMCFCISSLAGLGGVFCITCS